MSEYTTFDIYGGTESRTVYPGGPYIQVSRRKRDFVENRLTGTKYDYSRKKSAILLDVISVHVIIEFGSGGGDSPYLFYQILL